MNAQPIQDINDGKPWSEMDLFDLTIPPHENIVVSHQPSDDRGHVHVEVAIKHAFAAARRQIEALAQRASGKVKLHFRKPQNG
jgi:hypothetical protein